MTQVTKLRHVSSAAGALALTDTKISGTIPTSSGGSGGTGGNRNGNGNGSIKTSSFSVDGVGISTSQAGVLSSATITSGRTFSTADSHANVALVSSGYATAHGLKAGSTMKIAGTKFTITGVVSQAQDSSTVDVYIPLARAQALSGLKGDVNTIYLAADSSPDLPAVAREVSGALPRATVTTSSSLASQVSGSLSSAASLASNLGRWLSIAVLAATFGLASLLTMAAVSRRVRELGTLKALGWRSRRIVGQVMGEALAAGLTGGVAGVALGFAGAALTGALAPSLTASTGAAATVTVHLTPVVTLGAVAAAVLLAITSGPIAGSPGRLAARLRPAGAMSQLG